MSARNGITPFILVVTSTEGSYIFTNPKEVWSQMRRIKHRHIPDMTVLVSWYEDGTTFPKPFPVRDACSSCVRPAPPASRTFDRTLHIQTGNVVPVHAASIPPRFRMLHHTSCNYCYSFSLFSPFTSHAPDDRCDHSGTVNYTSSLPKFLRGNIGLNKLICET
jgi:hypothetical protein